MSFATVFGSFHSTWEHEEPVRYRLEDTQSCKRAYDAFEKFETWEYNEKKFEHVCRDILGNIPEHVRVVDSHLLGIDPHNYRKLAKDHPFRQIIARSVKE